MVVHKYTVIKVLKQKNKKTKKIINSISLYLKAIIFQNQLFLTIKNESD